MDRLLAAMSIVSMTRVAPRKMRELVGTLIAIVLSAPQALPIGGGGSGLEQTINGGFTYRNLGPFRAGSWVSDIAVPDVPSKAHLYTFYVGARNGGVWKTTNNGTTFAPVFDGNAAPSIGALAVAPSNGEIVL